MKALVYTGTQKLVYREEQNPIEVDGESILKVHASGICGSDMHAYHGHDERRIQCSQRARVPSASRASLRIS